jgi:hypothetical protein
VQGSDRQTPTLDLKPKIETETKNQEKTKKTKSKQIVHSAGGV